MAEDAAWNGTDDGSSISSGSLERDNNRDTRHSLLKGQAACSLLHPFVSSSPSEQVNNETFEDRIARDRRRRWRRMTRKFCVFLEGQRKDFWKWISSARDEEVEVKQKGQTDGGEITTRWAQISSHFWEDEQRSKLAIHQHERMTRWIESAWDKIEWKASWKEDTRQTRSFPFLDDILFIYTQSCLLFLQPETSFRRQVFAWWKVRLPQSVFWYRFLIALNPLNIRECLLDCFLERCSIYARFGFGLF